MKKQIILGMFGIFFLILVLASVESNIYITSGGITNNSVELYPFYYLGSNYSETNQSNSTDYFMEFYNASSYLLKSYNFSVLDDNLTKIFFFEVDIPDNTKRILFKNNSEYMKEINISENTPQVFNVSVTCSEISCEATWDANDSDNDNLSFDISYSNNYIDWNYIASDFESNYISFDTDYTPEGSYKLRVRVSDGFNFAENDSDYFNVSEKKPFAFITSPVNGSVFVNGTEIFFEGFGYDSEDGYLTENIYLIWNLNDEVVGYEELLLLSNLSVGDYQLRLEVNDSDDNKANDTIYFSVDNETEPDISVSKVEFTPETSMQLINGTISSIYLEVDLFNIRTGSFCNITLYDSNESFKNDTIWLDENQDTRYKAWWQPNSTGNHTIKISITGCEPNESNIENNEMVTHYYIDVLPNDTTKFYIKNNLSENVAWLGDKGNIVLKGECYNITNLNLTGLNETTAGEDAFLVRNSTGNIMSFIDTDGNLVISKGSCENSVQGTCNPSVPAFIIQDSSDVNVAYLNNEGGLCLTGGLHENADKDLLDN